MGQIRQCRVEGRAAGLPRLANSTVAVQHGGEAPSSPVRAPAERPTARLREQHAGRYLAEFEYRFNRRYELGEMIPRLAAVAHTTAPMRYRLLTLADVQA